MKYNVLDQRNANDILDRMDPPGNERPSVSGLGSKAGAGDGLEEEVIERLTKRLEEIKRATGGDAKQFDAEACMAVHEALPAEPDLLSDDGFWRWLALGPLQDIVAWRFPPTKRRGPEGEELYPRFNRQNFGVGASARQRAECYPYKLWLRGELGQVRDGGERYRFAQRGDVDFWTSHVLRQTYTTHRPLCAALVRFQYPDDKEGRPRLHPGEENILEGKLGIRTLAKRVKRLQASYELSIFSEAELEALLYENARDLTEAT